MMIRLILVFLCWLASTPAWSALSIVQSQVDAATQPWVTDGIAEVTFGADFTVGNTVCVGFALHATSRTVSSVQDDGAGGTNTYTLATTTENPGNYEGWIYCGIIERAANVVTVTLSADCACTGVIFGWEVGDARATSSIGNTSTNLVTPSATSHPNPASSTMALTDASAAFLGFSYSDAATWTIDADYTQLWNGTEGTGGSRIVSAADQMTNTTAEARESINLLVEVRPAAAAGAETFGFRLRVIQ